MPDDDDAALDAEIEAALTAADADADGVPKLGWRAWARSKLGRAADTSQLPETVAGPPPLVIADLLAQHAEKVAAVRAAMPTASDFACSAARLASASGVSKRSPMPHVKPCIVW